jgi:hypothetical protein
VVVDLEVLLTSSQTAKVVVVVVLEDLDLEPYP